jgi:hypothetical protein
MPTDSRSEIAGQDKMSLDRRQNVLQSARTPNAGANEMRYAYTGEWDAPTPILAIAEHRATVMTVGALVSDLNRCEMQAEARALDGTPALALPEVDESLWTTQCREFVGFKPGESKDGGSCAVIDDDLTPDDYRQIAAKALQLAAEAENK